MRLLDLFSGIGGFSLATQNAEYEFEWHGHSEIDKYACQIFHKHFPSSECLGDVKSIKSSNLPKLDIITFGFPCQDISVAGKRRGLHAERSGLFFEAMRIVEATKPKIFIFENVDGLFSADEGQAFKTVLRTIADIGLYDCEWQLLNTRWFLPQNRERIYFIGHFRGASRPKVFPIGQDNIPYRQKNESRLVQAEDCISGRRLGLDASITLVQVGTVGKDSEATRIYSSKGIARTIKNGGGMGAKTGLYEVHPCIRSEHHNTADVHVVEDFYPNRIREFDECPTIRGNRQGLKIANAVTPDAYLARGERKRDENGKAILTSMHERRIRRLTPTECERLQGFPDGWTEGLSDTQRYKCLGNAISVPVAEEIFKRLRQEVFDFRKKD